MQKSCSEVYALQIVCSTDVFEIFLFIFQASPAFEHLSAILSALDLPQPTKETSVFELLSDIERKVTDLMNCN